MNANTATMSFLSGSVNFNTFATINNVAQALAEGKFVTSATTHGGKVGDMFEVCTDKIEDLDIFETAIEAATYLVNLWLKL